MDQDSKGSMGQVILNYVIEEKDIKAPMDADVAEVAAPYMKTKTVIEAIITTKNINDSAITIKTTKDSKTNEEVRDLSFKETNTQETFEKVSEEKVPQFELKGGTTEIIATEITLVLKKTMLD